MEIEDVDTADSTTYNLGAVFTVCIIYLMLNMPYHAQPTTGVFILSFDLSFHLV